MSREIGLANKLFDLHEAKGLVTLVRSITQKHHAELAPVQHRLNMMLANDPRRKALELEYQEVVSRWRHKITQLGAKVEGLWVVEFDVGEGALCWRYPELSLAYFREREQAVSERVKLTQYIEEHDPDWAR